VAQSANSNYPSPHPRLLVITNLFPNAAEPNRGTFNAQQFAALAEYCALEVIAPVAWRSTADRTLTAAQRVGRHPTPYGDILVHHPTYYYIPRFLRAAYARLFHASILPTVQARWQERPFDLILGTWLYPDCVAAARIARRFGVPFLARTHGTDVFAHAPHRLRRRQMRRAARQARRVFCVSSELAAAVRRFAGADVRTEVLLNGVDLERFHPRARETARRELGLPVGERVILFVGHLRPVKGLRYLIEALSRAGLPGAWRLHILGTGELRDQVAAWAAADGIASRLNLAGEVPHAQVPTWMNAADLLVLPSLSEGCPNVVLESLACGTPVVASRVGAVPDIFAPECGILVPPADSVALAAALREAIGRTWERETIRRRVAGFSWRANAQRLYAAIQEALP